MGEFQVIQGDSLSTLRTLPDESANCCVTSPPYWGLRDYGTAKWEGGDRECNHTGVARRCDKPGRNDKQSTQKGSSSDRVSRECLLCGATRVDSQIGLEPTPEAYVSRMVEVFREVRRVLRADGTLWLNLGDSYTSGGRDNFGPVVAGTKQATQPAVKHAKRAPQPDGLKPKDLVGIPWRVAFALQADGWYLRSDIIWHKPNPMPESVTDRPTKAHEYLFLLAKSERYFYDADAIKEPIGTRPNAQSRGPKDTPLERGPREAGNAGLHVMALKIRSGEATTRNRRSVWTIATQPFPDAHFATFPPALVEPCILAGCPEGGTVLDSFCGSGTTGVVALRHGRQFVGIELNPAYCEMARRRIKGDAPLWNVAMTTTSMPLTAPESEQLTLGDPCS
jgi:DNA modification methylase